MREQAEFANVYWPSNTHTTTFCISPRMQAPYVRAERVRGSFRYFTFVCTDVQGKSYRPYFLFWKKYFLRASVHGAERVYGLYRQNQRDEGGGVSIIIGTFCEIVHRSNVKARKSMEQRLLRPLSSNLMSEVTSKVVWKSKWPQRPPK